jgi:hypothetical protein
MSADQEQVGQEERERRRQYEAELEPLVAAAAPKVREGYRAWLGRVQDLVPSGTDWLDGIPEEDRPWEAALEAVVHRYQLSYELVTDGDEATLWLVPLH